MALQRAGAIWYAYPYSLGMDAMTDIFAGFRVQDDGSIVGMVQFQWTCQDKANPSSR
jgi:hypothetical protein